MSRGKKYQASENILNKYELEKYFTNNKYYYIKLLNLKSKNNEKLKNFFSAYDSIVKRIGEGDYMYSSEDKYLLYDKSGDHLLTMTPHQQHDLNEKIETIEIKSPIFKN